MDLYPRESNKPERAEAVGDALRALIEGNLEIERWGFRLTFTKFVKITNIKIIYDSDWCRVKFKFSRVHYPGTDEILIDYGRLHAPNDGRLRAISLHREWLVSSRQYNRGRNYETK